ncbi:hypothetical protein DPEC_G00237100 [Dallia pectoralis]|uniref:Uncharacterized protein n=1 Tax=Dallia pectoralis TaxID=75939 RepID=A0ACC2FYY7_DALPE|nr:hypothetical protein DPEC_G00237100 [Dallia pectoralis]
MRSAGDVWEYSREECYPPKSRWGPTTPHQRGEMEALLEKERDWRSPVGWRHRDFCGSLISAQRETTEISHGHLLKHTDPGMRPRSRPLAKRGLPTIREGYEELVQDMNQANSRHLPPNGQAQSLSTHDYFLSICQLARPTFPQTEPNCDILAMGSLASLRPCMRNPAPPRLPFNFQVGCHTQLDHEMNRNECNGLERKVGVSTGRSFSREVPRVSDPLEYLYGHGEALPSTTLHTHNSQVWRDEGKGSTRQRPQPQLLTDSFPGMCSVHATHQKISCLELSLVDPSDLEKPNPDPALPQTLSSKQQKPDASSSLSWKFQNNLYRVSTDYDGLPPHRVCCNRRGTFISSLLACTLSLQQCFHLVQGPIFL